MSETEQIPDEPSTPDSRFYVSVTDGPRKFGLLAGPFVKHADALAMVDPARRLACKRDPWAHFYAFGTVQMANGERVGILNAELSVQP